MDHFSDKTRSRLYPFTSSGNVLYRAHATPDGHADRTTAGRSRYSIYRPPERTIAVFY